MEINEIISKGRPHLAVIDPNTLALIGMRQILESVFKGLVIDTYNSFDELIASDADNKFHYFVAIQVVLEHRNFFLERRYKTIVLTPSAHIDSQLTDFHCLCTNVHEEQLVKSVLQLEQSAHAAGKKMPILLPKEPQILSDREKEVLCLIVKGNLNKEIADQLHIGLTTVITHRKNIMEKLNLHSVSALTIYAVMHGYVSIDKI